MMIFGKYIFLFEFENDMNIILFPLFHGVTRADFVGNEGRVRQQRFEQVNTLISKFLGHVRQN